MLTPDQVLSVPKTQLATLAALGQRWLDGAEQLARLQLAASRDALTGHLDFTRELLDARSPEQLLSTCLAAAAPMATNTEAYCRSLYEIAASIGAEWSRLAGEQAADAQRQCNAALEGVLQGIPQGPGHAAAIVRQAISSATAAMESMQKAAMQAAEVTDANVKAMTRSANRKTPGAAD